jgi:hypothetical protein
MNIIIIAPIVIILVWSLYVCMVELHYVNMSEVMSSNTLEEHTPNKYR